MQHVYYYLLFPSSYTSPPGPGHSASDSSSLQPTTAPPLPLLLSSFTSPPTLPLLLHQLTCPRSLGLSHLLPATSDRSSSSLPPLLFRVVSSFLPVTHHAPPRSPCSCYSSAWPPLLRYLPFSATAPPRLHNLTSATPPLLSSFLSPPPPPRRLLFPIGDPPRVASVALPPPLQHSTSSSPPSPLLRRGVALPPPPRLGHHHSSPSPASARSHPTQSSI